MASEAAQGDPTDVLVGLADKHDADVLVIGNRGMQRRVPGSVPNTVTDKAHCTVYSREDHLSSAPLLPAPHLSFQAIGRARPYVPRTMLDHLAHEPEQRVQCVHGTCVFVDVSGFTTLSERLARRGGREGAEHLADAIGDCFERLLGVAYSKGGGLLKFGGDALLLLFNG